MRLLLVLLLATAACKHSTASSSTSHTETSTVTDSTTSESGSTTTVTTTTEAPGKTTTTVEEFAPPDEGSDGPGGGPVLPGLPAQDLPESPAIRKVPRHGPLVKRTVTVTEHGQETTQTRQEATQQAQGATETHAQAKADVQTAKKEESAPSGGCISLGWLWGLAALAFAGLLIFGALKFRKSA